MIKKSVARRHHYLPQSYLALFTDKGTRNGKFFVLEVETGHKFRTSPINVAVELDFNRIDMNGYPPDVIENTLAPFEQKAVQAISDTVVKKEFPNDENYIYILNLICLIAVRNPFLRNSLNRAREQEIDIIGNLLVSDKKLFEHHIQKARDSGEDIPEDVSYEDIKRFIEERNYKIEFSPGSNLLVELNTFNKILPLLFDRFWSLIIAPPEGPEFICSDHPVTINYKSGRRGPIGLGLPNTEIFFPFSRRGGFYGTYEDPLKKVVYAKPGNIATMNRRVADNAEKHVFSALESFVIWIDGKIQIVNASIISKSSRPTKPGG